MADSSDERALATWLAERTPEELARLFALRGVSASVSWRDFFDAAAGLLDPASVERFLVRMPRSELAALDAGSPDERAALVASGVVRVDGALPRSVASVLETLRSQHPSAFAPLDPPPAPGRAAADAEAAAAERVFASSAALADVLLSALQRPLGRTAAGPVSASDRKRLIEEGAVDDAGELDDLLESAVAAGLARGVDREWLVTARGEAWLQASTIDRWTEVASGFAAALPAALRTPDGGYAPVGDWREAFPLDAEWPQRAALWRRAAEAWGLVTATGAETPWGAALRETGIADASSLAGHLPAEIDRIYLQADLSAIAPGPLTPSLDLRLRGIATRESRAQASTYRFTPASIAAGLTEGETAASITTFLSELSLTGIPQPLAYLVESTAARHGLVRVRPDGVRTVVESADAALLAAIEVDQALRPLGFVRDEDVLISRVARDAVYWSLADARYPVTARDESGADAPLHRGRLAPEVDAPSPRHADLIARLRAAQGADADSAWRERELDQAVRARAVIAVVVRLPDGSSREFQLEATGLGGGRLRGRDRAADIERTLPISSIESVRPV